MPNKSSKRRGPSRKPNRFESLGDDFEADQHTQAYTKKEIKEYEQRINSSDPFIRGEIGLYKNRDQRFTDSISEFSPFSLFGVLGPAHLVDAYFASPEYQVPMSRCVTGDRSDVDCFGTGVLAILKLGRSLGMLPQVGIPDVDTTTWEQRFDFLEKQALTQFVEVKSNFDWCESWQRRGGNKSLKRLLNQAGLAMGIDSPPIATLDEGESFVFPILVHCAFSRSGDPGYWGHWYIVQVTRWGYDLYWTLHSNTDPKEGEHRSPPIREPSLFGILSSVAICEYSSYDTYPSEILDEYRSDLIRLGMVDYYDDNELDNKVWARGEMPISICLLKSRGSLDVQKVLQLNRSRTL